MKQVRINNLTIGDGSVKICVSIPGQTRDQVLEEIEYIRNKPFDMFEWRADLWENVLNGEMLFDMMKEIKAALPGKPFLFTYRTKDEGGLGDTDLCAYAQICEYAIGTNLPDIVDLEFVKMKDVGVSMIGRAHRLGVKVLTSYHSFNSRAPGSDEMIGILREQQQSGADIAKLAVTAGSHADSANIISAAGEMYKSHAEIPFILIGMGEFGKITRYARPFNGSSVTFAGGRFPTAPGQLSIEELA